MNERIKELWDKAAESTAAYPSGQNNSWEIQVNFMDRFAELIIKETLQVARAGIEFGDGMEDTVYRYFEIGMSTEDKKTLIKELLGVKNA